MKRAVLVVLALVLAAALGLLAMRAAGPGAGARRAPGPSAVRVEPPAARPGAAPEASVNAPVFVFRPSPVPAAAPPPSAGEAAAPSAGAAPPAPDVIRDEYVLGFFNDTDRAAFVALALAKGAEVLGTLGLGSAVRLRARAELLRELLREGPIPTRQSPNFTVRAPPAPPDDAAPYRPLEGSALDALGMTRTAGPSGKGKLIAVLDTPVYAHPSLREENLTRADFAGCAEAERDGRHSLHGTAVASIIAGSGSGVTGVAPDADLLSLPVLSSDGAGDTFTVAKGIVEAVNRGAAIVNLCLGTTGDCFLLAEAVRYALDRGVAVVASVGNDGGGAIRYPAAYDGVVAVSAVDAGGQPLDFANRGDAVDLAAPGVGLPAADIGGGVLRFSGTSASTPLVSGALAALMSREPALSAAEAVKALLNTADDTGPTGKDELVGNGVLNLARALGRNTPGIRDAAVALPFVSAPDGDDGLLQISVTVQNRGTEPLPAVVLDTEVAGRRARREFGDLGVGESAGCVFPVERNRAAEEGGVAVRAAARAVGWTDSNPGNDAVRATVTIQ